ncbi:MAG: DPP IV N-terminal domain-containing protein [Candidatus Acidiferrales bacterium]
MKKALLTVIFLGVFSLAVRSQQLVQSEREAMYYRYLEFASYVKGGSIEPHWMADGSSFWYTEGAPANTVIWKVDPRANTKAPLFDTARLRKALTSVLGHEPPYGDLPFTQFEFVEGEKGVKFTVEEGEFILQLETYQVRHAPVLSEEEKSRLVPQVVRRGVYGWPDVTELPSPDGSWFASMRDHNLWLRSRLDGRAIQMTSDGMEDFGWELPGARWSPDSSKLAIRKVDSRKNMKMPVVHWLKSTVEVEWFPSLASPARIGEPLPRVELYAVDIRAKGAVRIDSGEDTDHYLSIIGWRPDGSELLFRRVNRAMKKVEVLAADAVNGSTRLILIETQKTFIGGIEPIWPLLFTLLPGGERFIWMSESDGWRHLYLNDLKGKLIRRLTEGAFPVVQVVAVDEKAGWVYFSAHGDPQRPYDTHLYRVNLESKGFRQLTEGNGQHEIRFAPSKEFFLDTHSSIDRPPRVELTRADGTLLRTLAETNIEGLIKELKWRPPQEFVVKAADGETDLYGVLYKPYDFDPKRKYPVIEIIYGGPQFSEVQHGFTHRHFGRMEFHGEHAQALAQLGFIVFMVDGRGTTDRGKQFQDVAYGSIGRHEIPDHVAALQQLAEKRPYMDLTRVGLFGHSFGGYLTVRALLLAPEVYQVGVAVAGNQDRDDFEPYMDLPENNREGYEYASNPRRAANLRGKLLFIMGTSDLNTPFASIMKMAEALIQAGKPYDLIVLPEQSHWFEGASRTYALESIRRYFEEHLKP